MVSDNRSILYADCAAGIAGDMFAAALLDLASDSADAENYLRRALGSLPFDGWELEISKDKRGGISGLRFVVKNMEGHVHRHLSDIEKIIEESGLSEKVKSKALSAFRMLAEAEAKVHGTTPDHIHFHEVGAVDSIIDIVSAMVMAEYYGWPEICCSPLNVGSGTVKCAHGILPVPAPASAELLKGMETYSDGEPMERVTPTGALIVRTLAGATSQRPRGIERAAGYGLGSRESDIPNLLRATLIEAPKEAHAGLKSDEEVFELSANIDDMTGEELGYAMEKLLAAGALDVWFTPIQMKKNRPAVLLSVLANNDDKDRFIKLIFRHTSTFGIRYKKTERCTLERDIDERDTLLGKCRFKKGFLDGGQIRDCPEYEDMKALADAKDIPLNEVRAGIAAGRRRFRHYKGGEYEYLGAARHSEDETEYVIYRPLYNDSGLWIRPKEMFFENVNVNGIDVPRFAEIKDDK